MSTFRNVSSMPRFCTASIAMMTMPPEDLTIEELRATETLIQGAMVEHRPRAPHAASRAQLCS